MTKTLNLIECKGNKHTMIASTKSGVGDVQLVNTEAWKYV